MRFVSTRASTSSAPSVSFETAVLTGWASDGGLLMPERVPALTAQVLEKWSSLSYPELVAAIMGQFVDESEISATEWQEIAQRSFAQNFGYPADVVPLVQLSPNFLVAETFHGPTGAFKDLALSVLGCVLDRFLVKRRKKATVVVGTSGDTGSAAIYAVKSSPRLSIVVLYPKGRVSPLQERQMICHSEPNVSVFAVEGTSDDLDVPCRSVLVDSEFQRRHSLCSINSINICRLLVQIVHYFYAYFQAKRRNPGSNLPVVFAIPTGAAGNLVAGYLAVQMGLPITLLPCTNSNDIIHQALETGRFALTKPVQPTISPAIDILVPYNFERLLFLASSQAELRQLPPLMAEFEARQSLQVPSAWLATLRRSIRSHSIPDTEAASSLRTTHEHYKYLLDPHSAVAAAGIMRENSSPSSPRSLHVLLATAHPAKFSETLSSILPDVPNPAPPALRIDPSAPTYVKLMPKGADWEKMLRADIERLGTQGDVWWAAC